MSLKNRTIKSVLRHIRVPMCFYCCAACWYILGMLNLCESGIDFVRLFKLKDITILLDLFC